MNNFQDKTVWITGASSGIGEALAYQFAHAGAKVVLSARRIDELQRVANTMNIAAEKVLVLPMDMVEMDSFAEKVAFVIQHFGKIDVVIANAGISHRSSVMETSFDSYRKILEVDFFSNVAFTKAILPHFITQQSGHFVAISSVSGKIGVPLRSAYCAAKHALIGFFDSLRAEVWQDNIAVTLICPGYITTEISLNALNSEGKKHGKMDENQLRGMAANICAEKILKAIIVKKKEVYIGGFYETMGIYLKRFVPAIVYKMTQRKV